MLTAKVKLAGALLCAFFSFSAFATDVATVTLKNGAQVRLKDDFTWEYVLTIAAETVTPTSTPTPVEPNGMSTPKAVLASAPVASAGQASPKNSTTSAMSANSLLQSGLLASSAKDGVKVSYTDSVWRDNELGLSFELSSTNSDGVVIVEVEVTFYDDNGHKFEQQTVKAWLASYRQPDTYLRKGQTRMSRTIWLEDIDKQRWNKKLLSLKVLEVETR